MTPEDLDLTLDRMQQEAAAREDPGASPGLITVESGHWVSTLSALRPTCAALHDGMRHRNIKIHVSSTLETAVLSRSAAAEVGEPYRDLSARADAG